ncbi:peptidase S51 [Sediminicola sp. YIK13]|uniref:cyanophycinase n=1 Tax=Sediminicola sp. YIK13 TaxID=1453352 RepID=UPI0007217DF9|nr:cyanophycinase [Sediminicola sp. YIK13]ALM08560.1 peptidase S51 [Sediminicola sp. YIK13]
MLKISFVLFITLLLPIVSTAQENKVTTGNENGTLIAIGGGDIGHTNIMKEFRKLAGGDSAKIVVIPTAFVRDNEIDTLLLKRNFREYGIPNFTVLHTNDSTEVNTDDFVKPIKEATGIYFTGGRHWRIADSYLNTKVHKELLKLLDRGGVIAGSSAGATIQGSYLARGDTKNNQIMMGDHEIGFGFISNIVIDQHVLSRNRQFDMFTILEKKPELLGVGIDESTAIVVKGDTLQVIGESYVIIYDKSFWSNEHNPFDEETQKKLPNKNQLFYFLKSGDKYNLRDRKVIRN